MTTYDATVGDIIDRGKVLDERTFKLVPRGIVWVVSREEFHLPLDVTGLATLKTTWTHGGVLALNVGVIDPGWHGPVATALVNLGVEDFHIEKGQQFFRVLFHEHEGSNGDMQVVDRETYVEQIAQKSKKFSKTFLNMDSLISEVSNQVLSFPRWALNIAAWALVITVVGVIIGMAAIFVPVSIDVWKSSRSSDSRISALEDQVRALNEKSAKTGDKHPTTPM
nr:hypothetical protein [Paraburkholderia sp. Ac-20342]